MAKVFHTKGDITNRGLFVGYFNSQDLREQKDKREIEQMQLFYPQYRYIDSEYLDDKYNKTKKLEKIAFMAVWITTNFNV